MQYFGLILIQTWLWSVMGSGQIFGNCWNRMVSVKSGGCIQLWLLQQPSHKETTASSHENTTWHNFAKHLDCAQCDIWSPQKHIFSTKYQAFPCKETPHPHPFANALHDGQRERPVVPSELTLQGDQVHPQVVGVEKPHPVAEKNGPSWKIYTESKSRKQWRRCNDETWWNHKKCRKTSTKTHKIMK